MTIEGGALWGNVYRTLVDSRDGYMINGGRCPTVGVSGFILGGGIGPFSRQYGMACDNVREITIATADGEIYVVTPEDDPDSPEGMYLVISHLPLEQLPFGCSWKHRDEILC